MTKEAKYTMDKTVSPISGTEKTKLSKKGRLKGDCLLMLGPKEGTTTERIDGWIIEGR